MEKNEQRSNIPQNDPSKAMDSKREVAQSPDEKTDQDFPGYPHYPAKEDIMNQDSGAHRVDANMEDYGTGPNRSGVSQRFPTDQGNDRSQDTSNSGTAGNDLAATDTTNEEIGLPQNVTNKDLNSGTNLPGTDLDEAAGNDDGR